MNIKEALEKALIVWAGMCSVNILNSCHAAEAGHSHAVDKL